MEKFKISISLPKLAVFLLPIPTKSEPIEMQFEPGRNSETELLRSIHRSEKQLQFCRQPISGVNNIDYVYLFKSLYFASGFDEIREKKPQRNTSGAL